MDTSKHPFIIKVFGTATVTKGKGKRARTIQQGFGYMLWNPDEEIAEREGRLGFGSFAWYGLRNTRNAALSALAQDGIDQVAICTNQDRRIATLYKATWDRHVGQSRFVFAA